MDALVLVPTSWSWERDAVSFYTRNHAFFAGSALAYYPVIFGIQRFMRDRPAVDLGGHDTNARFNYIFWWEVSLAIFSMIGSPRPPVT